MTTSIILSQFSHSILKIEPIFWLDVDFSVCDACLFGGGSQGGNTGRG